PSVAAGLGGVGRRLGGCGEHGCLRPRALARLGGVLRRRRLGWSFGRGLRARGPAFLAAIALRRGTFRRPRRRSPRSRAGRYRPPRATAARGRRRRARRLMRHRSPPPFVRSRFVVAHIPERAPNDLEHAEIQSREDEEAAGSRIVNRAPPLGARPAETRPPWRSAAALTMASPNPDPGSPRASDER